MGEEVVSTYLDIYLAECRKCKMPFNVMLDSPPREEDELICSYCDFDK